MPEVKNRQQSAIYGFWRDFPLSPSGVVSAVPANPLARHFNPQSLLFLGVLFALLVVSLLPETALANTGQAGGLPYEDFLTKLRASMSGPVAFTLSLIGVIASGAALIFGGDLNGFFRSMIFLVLVVAIIIAANSLMTGFFQGAELTAALQPLQSALTARG